MTSDYKILVAIFYVRPFTPPERLQQKSDKRLFKALKALYSRVYSLKCIFRSIAPNDPEYAHLTNFVLSLAGFSALLFSRHC